MQAKRIINLLLFSNFYPVISNRRVQEKKGNDELLHTGSVTRYGPRTSCQRKELMEGWKIGGWDGNKTNSDWSFGGEPRGESRVIELWSANCRILRIERD